MKELTPQAQKAFDWVFMENGIGFLSSDEHCSTRDVFQARLETMNILLKRMDVLSPIASLVVIIAGEIGNNAFDHNLGNWRDEPGVYYYYDLTSKILIIADRGLGIRSTLQRVRPDIQNDCEALKIAFKEIISGRAPERRGNGLKLVEKTVIAKNMSLDVFSGDGHYTIANNNTILCVGEEMNYNGVIAILRF